MSEITLLHNPQCSKSREALALLEAEERDVEVVRYLVAPPSRAELEHIVDHVQVEPSALVRKDSFFKELGLDPDDYTSREAVVDLLLEHPRLMERPIAVKGDRVVLGRPPEQIRQLLDDEG